MATLAAAAARQASTLGRISTPKQAANLIQRRGLAGAAGKSHISFFFFSFILLLILFVLSKSRNPFVYFDISFYFVPQRSWDDPSSK